MKKILFLFNAKAIKLRQVLLDDFSRSGYDCYCALPKDDVAFWSEKYPQIHFVTFNNFSGTSVVVFDNLRTYFKIKNLIKQIHPDIVFCGNVKPNIYGGIAAHKCSIKHIYGLVSGLGYAFIDEPGLKRAVVKHICTFLYPCIYSKSRRQKFIYRKTHCSGRKLLGGSRDGCGFEIILPEAVPATADIFDGGASD